MGNATAYITVEQQHCPHKSFITVQLHSREIWHCIKSGICEVTLHYLRNVTHCSAFYCTPASSESTHNRQFPPATTWRRTTDRHSWGDLSPALHKGCCPLSCIPLSCPSKSRPDRTSASRDCLQLQWWCEGGYSDYPLDMRGGSLRYVVEFVWLLSLCVSWKVCSALRYHVTQLIRQEFLYTVAPSLIIGHSLILLELIFWWSNVTGCIPLRESQSLGETSSCTVEQEHEHILCVCMFACVYVYTLCVCVYMCVHVQGVVTPIHTVLTGQ